MNDTNHDRDDARVAALAADLRVLIGKLVRRLREQSWPGDLSLSQVSVLGRLERGGPATVTVLAKADCMRPQSMGAIVSALQEAGLVSGAPDPNDGRQTLWSVTDTCRERIKLFRAAREDWLHRAIQAHLTQHELEQLAVAVKLLERLAGD